MSAILPGRILATYREFIPANSLRERLSSGMFWTMAGAVISRGSMLAATILCARLLGAETFGALSMIQSTLGVFGVFAGFGLGLTATQYVAELRRQDPLRAGRVLALSTRVAVIAAGVVSLALGLFAPVVAARVLARPELSVPLAIGSGLVFFGAMNGKETGALAGFEAFRAIAIVNVVAGLISFPFVALGVLRGGLRGAVWALVASAGVNWLLNRHAVRRQCLQAGIRHAVANCSSELAILRNFSLPAFLASIAIGPAIWFCNTLLIHQNHGYAQLGIYTAADKWRLLILFIPTSAFGIVMPLLSNLYGDGRRWAFQNVFGANLRFNAALASVSALAVIVFARVIMSAYGTAFRSGPAVLIILAVSALPESLNTILGQPLVAAHMMWWRFAFDVFLVILLIGLAWMLIPKCGALGLATSYALSYTATSLALFVFLRSRPMKRRLFQVRSSWQL